MTVCCEHNRCPDRPTRWLRRFRTRPWFCDQCGRLWVTVPKAMNDHRWWEWRDLTVADPKPEPPPTGRIVLSPAAGEQTLTNKTIVNPTINTTAGAESNISMTPRVRPKGPGRLTINGEPLTREEAEMLAKLRDTVPGEGWQEGDRPGGETPVQTVDEAHRLANIDLDPNPFRRTGTDAERQWQQADDTTPTKFRVTANVYPSPFAEKTCAVATWTGTRFQIGEMAGEYADESDNPLLHMEIGTVEVLDD